MKNIIIKTVSIIICAAILITTSPAAFAAESPRNAIPLVYVSGEGAQLVIDQPDGTKRSIYPIKFPDGFVEQTVKDNLDIFAKAVLTQQWDEFCDVLYDVVSGLYADIRLDETGKPANGSRADWNWRQHGLYGQKLTGNYDSQKYVFYYDWRLDPYKSAETLHEYIEYVVNKTGSETVALSGRCLGACVISAYMEKYDGEYISDLIYYASALNGATQITKAFCGELYLDADGVERYIYDFDISADQNINELIQAFVTLFNDTFGLDVACWSINNVYPKIYMNIVPRLLIDTFGSFPGYWSMVSDKDYQKAKDTVFHGADMDKYSEFIDIIDNYHYNVQCKAPENFKKYTDRGIEIATVVKYGYQTLPITEDADILSDDICDVYSASMGATTTELGKSFGKKYMKAAAENGSDKYISPDKQIDASTCYMPDRTWFIKNIAHKNFPNIIDSLFNEIINNDGYTVFTDENYPQYLVYDKTEESEILLPMTDENKDTDSRYKVSFFKALGRFFKSLFNVIRDYFRQLIADRKTREA